MKKGLCSVMEIVFQEFFNYVNSFQNLDKYQAASGTMIRDYLPIIDEAKCKKSSGSTNYSIQICAGGERGKNPEIYIQSAPKDSN